MEERILLGRDQEMLEIPQATWKQHLTQIPQHSQTRLNFMINAHHQVRYFVVRELVNQQQPLKPKFIADALQMPLDQVDIILEELESRLFFLVRNEQQAVVWAYPVTVEVTPHRLSFSSGERLFAA